MLIALLEEQEELVSEMKGRMLAEEALQRLNAELEIKVAERTQELLAANIRLQELDHLKSMFIASMSHELRTPLNSIIGFTGLILMGFSGSLTEEQKTQLTMVKKSANHLLSLINDVIDVSKIETGKIKLEIEKFNLPDLLGEVRDSLQLTASRKGLIILLETPQTLSVESDRRRIRQVVVNLVGNAVKFTDSGEIRILAAEKNGNIEIAVSDTAPGSERKTCRDSSMPSAGFVSMVVRSSRVPVLDSTFPGGLRYFWGEISGLKARSGREASLSSHCRLDIRRGYYEDYSCCRRQ
jgi:hypothetical protein